MTIFSPTSKAQQLFCLLACVPLVAASSVKGYQKQLTALSGQDWEEEDATAGEDVAMKTMLKAGSSTSGTKGTGISGRRRIQGNIKEKVSTASIGYYDDTGGRNAPRGGTAGKLSVEIS